MGSQYAEPRQLCYLDPSTCWVPGSRSRYMQRVLPRNLPPERFAALSTVVFMPDQMYPPRCILLDVCMDVTKIIFQYIDPLEESLDLSKLPYS